MRVRGLTGEGDGLQQARLDSFNDGFGIPTGRKPQQNGFMIAHKVLNDPSLTQGVLATPRSPVHSKRLALACSFACLITLVGCSSNPKPTRPDSGGGRAPSLSVVTGRVSDSQAQEVTLHAMTLVGTPYRYGGNTPASGFDCSGLIGYVYRETARVVLPRTTAQLKEAGQAVDTEEGRAGDLVIFGSGGRASHAGIYVGNGKFVHAPSTGGTVRLDSINSKVWAPKLIGFRRI